VLSGRFWDKVITSDIHFYKYTACWEWTACIHHDGYGQFKLNGKNEQAHRLSYEDKFGTIHEGLEIDHLCRNRKCVNPDHLEPVTHPENVKRGLAGFINGLIRRAKTHCPQGHEYSKENTYVYPNGKRMCRTCNRIRHQPRIINFITNS